MKLTTEVIARADVRFSPLEDRELILRGLKISEIEALGATRDQFDALDFTDNAIQRLDNFPLLTKLKTLLLGANQISRVGDDLGRNLPALETLVLTNNRIASLTEVDALSSLQSLRLLSLLHNSVAKRPHYRLFVIHKLPNLRVLDFQKVRARERLAAKKLFASKEGKQLLAAVARARAFLPGEVIAKAERAAHKRLSARQIAAILSAVERASTPEEIDQLEAALSDGVFPDHLLPNPAARPTGSDGDGAAGGGGGGSGGGEGALDGSAVGGLRRKRALEEVDAPEAADSTSMTTTSAAAVSGSDSQAADDSSAASSSSSSASVAAVSAEAAATEGAEKAEEEKAEKEEAEESSGKRARVEE